MAGQMEQLSTSTPGGFVAQSGSSMHDQTLYDVFNKLARAEGNTDFICSEGLRKVLSRKTISISGSVRPLPLRQRCLLAGARGYRPAPASYCANAGCSGPGEEWQDQLQPVQTPQGGQLQLR